MTIENEQNGSDRSTVSEQAGFDPPDAQAKGVTAAVKDESSNVAHTALDAGKDVAHEATTQAAAVAGQAKEQLGAVVSQAKDELRSELNDRSEQAANGLRKLSEQMKALTDGRPQQAGQLGALLGDAQLRVQAYAQSISQRGPQALFDDVAAFARRRPTTFLFVAAAAGFATGRLVRGATAVVHDQSHVQTTEPRIGSAQPAALPQATYADASPDAEWNGQSIAPLENAT